MLKKKPHKMSKTEERIKKLKQQKLESLYVKLINISFNDKEQRNSVINGIHILESELNVSKIDYKVERKVYKTNRYERKRITQNKYKKLSEYYRSIFHDNIDGYYKKDNDNHRKIKRYYKNFSNKKVRRSDEFQLVGSGYKKVYDYGFKVF